MIGMYITHANLDMIAYHYDDIALATQVMLATLE